MFIINKRAISLLIFLLIAIILKITFHLAYTARTNAFNLGSERFQALTKDTLSSLQERLISYNQALIGGAGFFQGSHTVSIPEWKSYVDELNVAQTFPSIRGMGYIAEVKKEKIDEFMATVRKSIQADFSIHPQTTAKPYYIIQYFEPLATNQGILGLNIAFEKNRREAAEYSRDNGTATLTKPIMLFNDPNNGPGFLLFHPFYKPGLPLETVEQKRQAFLGWIYAPLTAKALLNNITRSQQHLFNLTIYAGIKADPQAIIYKSTEADQSHHSLYQVSQQTSIMQQPWLLVWSSTSLFDNSVYNLQPFLIIFIGVGVALALGLFFLMLLRRTDVINRLVDEKTKEISANEQQLKLLIQHTPAAVAMFDKELRYLLTSERWIKDYHLEDTFIIGKGYYEIFPEILAIPKWLDIHQRALAGEIFNQDEDSWLRADGKLEWVKWAIHPWRNAAGEIGGIVMFTEVITARKEAEIYKIKQTEQMQSIAKMLEDSLNEIYIFDAESLYFIQVNRGGCQNLGYSLDELRSMTPIDINPDFTAETYNALLAPLRDGKQDKISFHSMHRRKDGTLYDVEVHAQLGNYLGRPVFFNIVLDETERKNSEQRTQILNEVAVQAAEHHDINSIIETVLRKICLYLKWPLGHAYSWDEEAEVFSSMKIWYCADDSAAEIRKFRELSEEMNFSLGSGLPGRVLQKQSPIFIEDIATDANFPRNKSLKNLSLHAAVGIPIFINQQVVAVLEFFHDKKIKEDKSLLDFCNLISLSLSRIIEYRKVEQALEASNRLNKAVLASTAYIIIAIDTTGKIIVFNRAAEIGLGYSAKEVINQQTPAIFYDPEEIIQRARELSLEYNTAISAGIDVFTYIPRLEESEIREWTLIHKNGSRFPVLLTVTPLRDKEKQVVGFLGVIEDITLKKQQQEALQASEETFRFAMEYASIGMALVSLDGKWLKVNQALCNLLGYSASELAELDFQSITYPEDLRLDLDFVEHTLSGEIKNYQLEKRYLHKNGNIIWTLLSVSLVRNGDDSPKYFISQIQDITQKKEMERMKNEFISMVSHELRTPLTSIRGSLGLIMGTMSQELPAKANHLLSIAHKNSERLILLINDILDIDKIASGQMRFDFKQENIVEIVTQTIEANRAYAEKFNVTLSFVSDETQIDVNVDPERLSQVLTNLISNAAKFSPELGKVLVIITRKENTVRIGVKDNGPGIPEDFRAHIFSKFSQADSSVTRKKGGTGLGLYISKQIIEVMHGKIGFNTKVGAGTTFWIDLPILDANSLVHSHPAAIVAKNNLNVPTSSLSKGHSQTQAVDDILLRPKILHIEDDLDLNKLLVAALQGMADITVATTIQEAKQQLKQAVFNLIILDITLPDASGLTILDFLGENQQSAIPVIILSASETSKDVQQKVAAALVKSKVSETKIIDTIIDLIHSKK